MARMATTPWKNTKVAIACQGGGSHTAFTAGVLKALLDRHDSLIALGESCVETDPRQTACSTYPIAGALCCGPGN
jgi:hypothetical protein